MISIYCILSFENSKIDERKSLQNSDRRPQFIRATWVQARFCTIRSKIYVGINAVSVNGKSKDLLVVFVTSWRVRCKSSIRAPWRSVLSLKSVSKVRVIFICEPDWEKFSDMSLKKKIRRIIRGNRGETVVGLKYPLYALLIYFCNSKRFVKIGKLVRATIWAHFADKAINKVKFIVVERAKVVRKALIRRQETMAPMRHI